MKIIKTVYITVFVAYLSSLGALAQTTAQDSTGLPGDNFDLAGALEIFKKANSPEEFEKMLNSEDSKVNNLDLNGDGEIDYIKVIDKKEGDAHAFILQDAVSENENQDVAVVEVERNGADNASVQIVGDKDLYGEEVVVEPTPENAAPANAAPAPAVNVYDWPAVRYVYAPSYGIWVSPFQWRMHPVWYRPWRPVGWRVFYPYRAPYHHRYAVIYQPRLVAAHRIYTPVRTVSATVQTRNQVRVTQYRATRTTRTTTVNTGNRKVTRKTTKVEGRNGKVRRTRTTRVRKE